MENISETLAANIQRLRKKNGWTQEELAQRLGVTFQAVSKWENAKAMPDILLLPSIADHFSCHIDELFSREVKSEIHYDLCAALPWNDDNVIRGVVCQGKKILEITEPLLDRYVFEYAGDAKRVESQGNITVTGSVQGGCSAGGELTVLGNMSGDCTVGGDVTTHGDLCGDILVSGDVTAKQVKGTMTCRSLRCDKIEGTVTVRDIVS